MLNPFKEINWNPGLRERRSFARSLMIGFPIVAVVLGSITRVSTGEWKPFFLWLGIGGFVAGSVFWAIPQIARPFYAFWYFIAACMGIVVGNVLLGSFYYIVLTPIGLLLRLFGRAPMRKNFDKQCASYWRDAEKVVDLKRYYRQF